jgi:predicted ATPase/class 3 adenylate cyclase
MTALPTGTVTFLFTDIQGSTALWQQYPNVMPDVIARHDALLKEIVEAHNGVVFRTVGDAIHAAFTSPADAVAAALEAQRALTSEPWPDDIPLRVRMGIHTGAVEVQAGEYAGHTLNRVARLTASGHGGQVLLSAATAELVRGDLPPDVALRDMGEHRLKDLVIPERIYQVEAPDLPTDFPALRTLDEPRTNVPSAAGPVIGRAKEIGEARDLLKREDVRLVTFTGAGGTGKTTLALAVGRDLADSFPDGVWLVSLAAISDPTLIPSAITSSLGLRDEGSRTPMQTLLDFLTRKRLLLILDNFEQVVGAAPLVAELLQAAWGLTILATSRIALRVRAEREFPIAPLSVPDREGITDLDQLTHYAAIQLFLERAQDVKPSFTLTDENARAVAEICARLDGLPLAIELAAARIRVLTPQALLRRLEKRLPLLTGGAYDLPVRQQTMEAAIAWSYDLLGEEEQRLYRDLSVFVGGFSLEGAEAVCAGDNPQVDVLDGITSLVDKSLVRQEEISGEPRFSMLQTIREYGLERLDECAGAEDLRRRHASYFVGLAESLERVGMAQGPGPVIGLLEMERDNLRAALHWSLAEPGDTEMGLRLMASMMFLWAFGGHSTEGRAHAEALLARPDAAQYPNELAGTLVTLGALEEFAHESVQATSHLKTSDDILRRSGDSMRLGLALQWLGITAIGRGDIEDAVHYQSQSRDHGRSAGLPWLEANSLSFLAEAMVAQEKLDEVRAVAEEALEIYRALGDAWGIARVQRLLAGIAWLEGDYATAHTLCAQAIEPLRRAGENWNLARTLTRMGIILVDEEQYEEAEDMLTEGLLAWRNIGNEGGMLLSLAGLAAAAAARGNIDRARRLYAAQPFHRDRGEVILDTISNREYEHLVARIKESIGAAELEELPVTSLDQAIRSAIGV